VAAIARWVCMVGVLTCAGCGGESRELLETKRDLHRIGLAYHIFHADRGRGPHNADELLAHEPGALFLPTNATAQSDVRNALQSGNYVVIWDVAIQTPGEKNSGKVLAYRRDVPEKGGAVCYQDGSVRVLTREEFHRAPRASARSDTPSRP
jgi:hypothetical protein